MANPKCEQVYLKAYTTTSEIELEIRHYTGFNNKERSHEELNALPQIKPTSAGRVRLKVVVQPINELVQIS
ncbi:hypothetical protein XM79_c20841 [Vibrio vulnificus]|nr:hypothetical protein XM72_c11994 [Vibrio vulnificus]OQK55892.1 hypothetical protein XM77_c11903 [Vibrio vulnificus]OQK59593.1 hypothetical protein XM78_c20856 [Vibrio vulnificus]OQK62539.1 hypothetical protein XM79_c20841 [Vibrio vulnificus]